MTDRAPVKPKHVSRFAVRDEFLNLDFPTVGDLHSFSLHPFMLRLTRDHLEPMVQFFLRIREEFSWTPESKSERERMMLRQCVRSYFDHAEHVADIVIRYKDLAAAHRVPAPSVSWLQVVMRAENLYGFEGDNDTVLRCILTGKMATLFQYSTDLRQNAVDRSFIGDRPSKIADDSFGDGDPSLEEGETAI
ncbi:hypothetical protein DFH09DRAFT_1318791 [Mycena vulgaris]|nr:hypothetical protein DFH09DRAFT_1318791 [Mycena vulgaris]